MQRQRVLRQLLSCARSDIAGARQETGRHAAAIGTLICGHCGGSGELALEGAAPLHRPSSHHAAAFRSLRAPRTGRPITTSAAPLHPRGGGGGGGQGGGGGDVGDVSEAEAAEAMREIAEAFQKLVEGAWELAQKGQPLEAEALLAEGAKHAAEIMGADAVELAPLHDQLAVLRFFHDRCAEAVGPARAAHDLLVAEGEAAAPVAALAAVRLASVLLGSGNPHEAGALLGEAVATLRSALEAAQAGDAADLISEEEAAERVGKFEAGLAEARLYAALCALCAPGAGPAAVAAAGPELSDALRALLHALGPSHPLAAAALREHNRLVERAMEAEDLTLAEALYRQELALHREFEPVSEHVAMLGYQLGTLQYVLGKYPEARATLEKTVDLLRSHFDGTEQHLLTVRHRLAMVRGAAGDHGAAREELTAIAPDLVEAMGAGNPITHELNFMTALMALRDLAAGAEAPSPAAAGGPSGSEEAAGGGGAAQEGGEARRQRLLEELRANLEALMEYGEGHMLVKKARTEAEPWLGAAAPAAARLI